MPLSSLASYLSTTQDFITHWTQWNTTTLGNNQLSDGSKVADLTAQRTGLQTAITAVETPRNSRETAAQDRDNKRVVLREKLRQFRARCQSDLRGSVYQNAAPAIPPTNSGEGLFMRAMDDMQSLWVTINATPPAGFTAPLKLVGLYTAANHATDIAALRTTYTNYNTAAQQVELRLGERDALLEPIKNRLLLYRQTILGSFPAGDPLILSLPRVTPLAGSTPRAVILSATWNPATDELDLSWTGSTNAHLDHFSLRSCDPPRYRAADEEAVQSIDKTLTSISIPGADCGLGVSGAVKFFKLYVVTDDDNEKGSKSVKVSRP